MVSAVKVVLYNANIRQILNLNIDKRLYDRFNYLCNKPFLSNSQSLEYVNFKIMCYPFFETKEKDKHFSSYQYYLSKRDSLIKDVFK